MQIGDPAGAWDLNIRPARASIFCRAVFFVRSLSWQALIACTKTAYGGRTCRSAFPHVNLPFMLRLNLFIL